MGRQELHGYHRVLAQQRLREATGAFSVSALSHASHVFPSTMTISSCKGHVARRPWDRQDRCPAHCSPRKMPPRHSPPPAKKGTGPAWKPSRPPGHSKGGQPQRHRARSRDAPQPRVIKGAGRGLCGPRPPCIRPGLPAKASESLWLGVWGSRGV